MEFKILMAGVEDAVWEPLLEPFLDLGYNAAPALSAEEAKEILARTKLDLLVLDLDTLGSSGTELAGRLRAGTPLAKVLALSADPEKERQLRDAGFNRFLRKPVAREELVEAMCTLLLEKDAEEVGQILPGLAESGGPGREWPRANILLLEPDLGLARSLIQLLRDPLLAEGLYFVRRTGLLSHALNLLLRHKPRPHLVVADLSAFSFEYHPEEAVRKLLACEIQPRDYVFFMHSGDKNRPLMDSLPGRRWTGNPWDEENLRTLIQLVGRTALEHHLVVQ